ncbi:MAG: 1,2-phenylacetyl-CoA epoxidase subunit PaaD [Pseudomonadota bacterium]
MVMGAAAVEPSRADAAWAVLSGVMDPEIPVVSVVDLGIVREVREEGGELEVIITPTYTGCPATKQIEFDVRLALDKGGFEDAALSIALAPAWSTDWITEKGRAELKAFGIAPPEGAATSKRELFSGDRNVQCPHCGARDTEMVSEFGSTACKSLWRCRSCREPFDYFKCI